MLPESVSVFIQKKQPSSYRTIIVLVAISRLGYLKHEYFLEGLSTMSYFNNVVLHWFSMLIVNTKGKNLTGCLQLYVHVLLHLGFFGAKS